jgi:tetratricopeptide (TPR) repeat protein
MGSTLQIVMLGLLLAFLAHSARAQQDQQKQDSQKKTDEQPQESSSKKNLPDPDAELDEKREAKKGEKTDDKSAKPSDKYDPYPAQKDLEVGMFYLHKGNVDAAIERFKDAIEQRPNFAKPRLLLAEAYEKKGDKAEALKYYKEYLHVFPTAPDLKSVRKKIEKLSGQ